MRDPSSEEEPGLRGKIFADVIESLLGLVYIEFGYETSVEVGNELGVTLPWNDYETSVVRGVSGESGSKELLDVVYKSTGHKNFCLPKLVDEAFTHPSAVDAAVPSYQRLEWIGDAVLCLCVREWLFRRFADRTYVGDMVTTEGAVVSNETLGFLSMKYGLQQYLNHRDQSLPKRIESYFSSVRDGNGLWGAGT
jgi:dsRNA-specific ribonuclease